MSHHGGHHGCHSHGNMISANIGDQVAAGGAGRMNARQRQYWDRWIQRGRFAGLWQFGLLIVLFIVVAAVPVALDFYMASMGQPDSKPASEQSGPGEETAAQPAQQDAQPAPQYAQPAPQYAQPAPQASGAWSQTPGYEPDFGHPNSSPN